ncbi:hypothetical protein B0H13DRAFT_2341362 [Mycena leptocephala]|nr:hypothetical protein B0H13DRAFT_2341362 [Mycena leptocephala]
MVRGGHFPFLVCIAFKLLLTPIFFRSPWRRPSLPPHWTHVSLFPSPLPHRSLSSPLRPQKKRGNTTVSHAHLMGLPEYTQVQERRPGVVVAASKLETIFALRSHNPTQIGCSTSVCPSASPRPAAARPTLPATTPLACSPTSRIPGNPDRTPQAMRALMWRLRVRAFSPGSWPWDRAVVSSPTPVPSNLPRCLIAQASAFLVHSFRPNQLRFP